MFIDLFHFLTFVYSCIIFVTFVKYSIIKLYNYTVHSTIYNRAQSVRRQQKARPFQKREMKTSNQASLKLKLSDCDYKNSLFWYALVWYSFVWYCMV